MGPVPELRRGRAGGPTGGPPLCMTGRQTRTSPLCLEGGACTEGSPGSEESARPLSPDRPRLTRPCRRCWASPGLLSPGRLVSWAPLGLSVPCCGAGQSPAVSGSREKYVRTQPWRRASCPSYHRPCGHYCHGGRGRSSPGGCLWKVQVENFMRARACRSAPILCRLGTGAAGGLEGHWRGPDLGPVWLPLGPHTVASVLYPQDPALALGPGQPGLQGRRRPPLIAEVWPEPRAGHCQQGLHSRAAQDASGDRVLRVGAGPQDSAPVQAQSVLLQAGPSLERPAS